MNLDDLKIYRTVLFDCDGVLINSNKVKTDAFYHVATSYGGRAAQSLVEHHQKNGGVSRYSKFDFFLREIIGVTPCENIMQGLLNNFAGEVENGLQKCEKVSNLQLLRALCEHMTWLVVSGGNQEEVRKILNTRDLANCFDGGIYGSPDTKEEIIKKYVCAKSLSQPILFIGDSKYDYEVANMYGYDFLYVRDWSEWIDWQDYQRKHKFPSIDNLENWINSLSDC